MSHHFFEQLWNLYQTQMSRLQWRHYFRRNPDFESWMLDNEPDALNDILNPYAHKRLPVFQ